MQFILLVIIGLSSGALVVLGEGRWLVGALVVQWLGLAWLEATVSPSSDAWLGVAVEVVTALVCGAILALTLFRVDELQPDHVAGPDTSQAMPSQARRERRF